MMLHVVRTTYYLVNLISVCRNFLTAILFGLFLHYSQIKHIKPMHKTSFITTVYVITNLHAIRVRVQTLAHIKSLTTHIIFIANYYACRGEDCKLGIVFGIRFRY